MSTINPNLQKPAPQDKGLIPESVKIALILVLLLLVVYLFYAKSQTNKAQQAQQAAFDELATRVATLETNNKVTEASLSSKVSDLKSDLDAAVGSTQADFKKTTTQIQAEGKKTKEELAQAISSKADTSHVEEQVRAAKAEAESKIGQVSSEVGGMKSEVGTVKSDLANTRRDLEGTQRQLVDVRDTLGAAVAKNSSEVAQLRLKGERDYFEFTIPDKKSPVKVEDIRLLLTNVDPKKGKFNLRIFVDDSQLEKRDRLINEPIQFLVGQNRIRYEIVINSVQKNKVVGYLSIPKDKALSAERPKK
jgi:chromosome segregation ATPase